MRLTIKIIFFFFVPHDIRRSSIIQEFVLGSYPRVLRNRSWYDEILEFNWRRQTHTCYTHHLLVLLLLLLLLPLPLPINHTETPLEGGTGGTEKHIF